MSRDTVNVRDPIEGITLDVPDHPANGTTAVRIRQLHERAQDAEESDDPREYAPADPHDYPDKYSYGMGDELPVLIRSNMDADPVEGVQGTFTEIVEQECDACGYDRADHTVHTMAEMHRVECRACGNVMEEM